RNWHCFTCQKSYNRKADLIRHIKLHAGNRPFSCNYCHKRYTAQYSVSRHQR
ncbi:hypothetical protein BJ085DRAFT_6768, partial [Dimargaris cristalligena]